MMRIAKICGLVIFTYFTLVCNGLLGASAEDDCRFYKTVYSLLLGAAWDPNDGPLEFSVRLNAGSVGLRFFRILPVSSLHREIRVSTRPEAIGTGVLSWLDENQVLLVDIDPHPRVNNDGMEHTFSLSISADGLVTFSELTEDGSLLAPPLFTFEDSTVDTSVPWFYQTSFTPDEDGVNPTFKICNVKPPLISEFKQAFQSSTSEGSIAARAVDGLFPIGNEVAQTDVNANSWWWRVDLGKEYVIRFVLFFLSIYPSGPPTTVQTDDIIVVGSCPDNFPQDGVTCGDPIDLATPNLPVGRICPAGAVGQFVQLMNSNDPQYYSIYEVMVYGIEVPDSSMTTFNFSRTAYSVSEGDGPIAIEIVRTGISQCASIDIVSVEGTATAPEDFNTILQSVPFNSVEDTQMLFLTISDDQLAEANEQLTLQLTNAVGGDIVYPDRILVTIIDNDGPQYFLSSSVYTGLESSGRINVEVQRTNTASEHTMLRLNLRRITAQAPEDFDDTPVDVIFEANKDTATAMIPINDNDEINNDKTLDIVLELADAIGTIDPERNQAVATIRNDDVIHFMAEPMVSALESDDFSVVVKKNGYLEEESSIMIQTLMLTNSAQDEEDYIPIKKDIVFEPYMDTVKVDVNIVNDDLVEPEESFVIRLSSDDDADDDEIDDDEKDTTVFLIDDDASYSIEQNAYAVQESDLTLQINVIKTGNLSMQSEAYITTSDGTADATTDYVTFRGLPVQFAPGQNSATVTLSILDDNLIEEREQFAVFVSSAPNGDNLVFAYVSINDDDAMFSFTQPSSAVMESSGVFTASIERQTLNMNSPAVIRVSSVFTGSAMAFDVTSIDKSVTFQSGQTFASLIVDIAVDNEVEDDEVFTLALSVADGGALGRFPNLVVTIIDTTEIPKEESKGLSGGALGGIIIGGIVVVAFLLALATFVIRQFLQQRGPAVTDGTATMNSGFNTQNPYPIFYGGNWSFQ